MLKRLPRPVDGRPMDAAGAETLRWRIEQQQHWRQAQAVLDGRQPSVDPDQNDLETFEGDLRIYSSRSTRDGTVRLCKRLVDGAWQHGTVDEQLHPASDLTVARIA
jgi:hypothetical protein